MVQRFDAHVVTAGKELVVLLIDYHDSKHSPQLLCCSVRPPSFVTMKDNLTIRLCHGLDFMALFSKLGIQVFVIVDFSVVHELEGLCFNAMEADWPKRYL